MKRFSGFHELYEKYRPVLPQEIVELICKVLSSREPELLVDLGCGTGNSTALWRDISKNSIGIDSNPEMIEFAKANHQDARVHFQLGYGFDTGLLDKSTDIVTCSSSIHWMEPVATLSEIVRILKPGGVFAAYGPQIPYFLPECWETAILFNDFWTTVKIAEKMSPTMANDRVWKWAEIINYIKMKSCFRYFDELTFNHTIKWNSDDYLNWVRTLSQVNTLINENNQEIINAFNQFKNLLKKNLGTQHQYNVHLSYRMLLGIL